MTGAITNILRGTRIGPFWREIPHGNGAINDDEVLSVTSAKCSDDCDEVLAVTSAKCSASLLTYDFLRKTYDILRKNL